MVTVSYKLSFIYLKELTEESTCGVVSLVCFKFLYLFVLLSLEWCYCVISWFKGFLWRKFNYGIWLYMCDLQGVKINSWMESITRACKALDHTISFQNSLVLPYIWFLIGTDFFLGTWEYKLLCCYWYFSCNISISVSYFFYPNFRGSGLWSLFFFGIYFGLCGYIALVWKALGIITSQCQVMSIPAPGIPAVLCRHMRSWSPNNASE